MAGGAGHGQHPGLRRASPAIKRCCCSTATATVLPQDCDQAMFTAPMAGSSFYYRRSNGGRSWARKSGSGPMRPLPSPTSMKHWRAWSKVRDPDFGQRLSPAGYCRAADSAGGPSCT